MSNSNIEMEEKIMYLGNAKISINNFSGSYIHYVIFT